MRQTSLSSGDKIPRHRFRKFYTLIQDQRSIEELSSSLQDTQLFRQDFTRGLSEGCKVVQVNMEIHCIFGIMKTNDTEYLRVHKYSRASLRDYHRGNQAILKDECHLTALFHTDAGNPLTPLKGRGTDCDYGALMIICAHRGIRECFSKVIEDLHLRFAIPCFSAPHNFK